MDLCEQRAQVVTKEITAEDYRDALLIYSDIEGRTPASALHTLAQYVHVIRLNERYLERAQLKPETPCQVCGLPIRT